MHLFVQNYALDGIHFFQTNYYYQVKFILFSFYRLRVLYLPPWKFFGSLQTGSKSPWFPLVKWTKKNFVKTPLWGKSWMFVSFCGLSLQKFRLTQILQHLRDLQIFTMRRFARKRFSNVLRGVPLGVALNWRKILAKRY